MMASIKVSMIEVTLRVTLRMTFRRVSYLSTMSNSWREGGRGGREGGEGGREGGEGVGEGGRGGGGGGRGGGEGGRKSKRKFNTHHYSKTIPTSSRH